MAKNAYVNVRVDQEIKVKAEHILNELGINTSTAIDIYLNQIILKNGLPFDVKIPRSEDIFEIDEIASQLQVSKPYPSWLRRIAYLYSIGDISLSTALFAGKERLHKR